MVIFLFSRWRPAAILNFDTSQKWRYGTLRTVHIYHRAKCCNCMPIDGWLLRFVDHPRRSLMVLKSHRFGVNRIFAFQDNANLKFWKFGLKRLFRPPKFTFYGVLTPKCYFSLLRPPKGTSSAENTPFEPSTVAVWRAVRPGRWAKNTKNIKRVAQKWECTAKIWVVAQTPPVNRSLPNFVCVFVSRMCFLVSSFRKIGWKMWELWGSKFLPSHWKGTPLIQLMLVATAQAMISAVATFNWNAYRYTGSTYF